MTLEEFVDKYNGKKVDFDGVYGCQCVDLFRQYVKDVWEIEEHTGPCATTGGAKDLFLDYNKMPLEKKYFTKVSTKTPKTRDVVIWNSTPTNKYGHVAICLGLLKNSVIVFEQDGFRQDGAKINVRSKQNMLGVLRKNTKKEK